MQYYPAYNCKIIKPFIMVNLKLHKVMKNNQINVGMITNLSKIILFTVFLCIPISISAYAQSKYVQDKNSHLSFIILP